MGVLADINTEYQALLSQISTLTAQRDAAIAAGTAKDTQIVTLNTQITNLQAALDACEEAEPGANLGPSGVAVPTSNLTGWNIIFSDGFDTDIPLGQFPVQGGKWSAYPTTYKDTSRNGTYDPGRTISVTNSVMNLHMFTDSTGVVRVSAPVPMIRPPVVEKWPGQLYGRYSVMARFPDLMPGFKVAWLLWPDVGTNTTGSPDGIGGNGEIDFPEHGLGQQSSTSAFMHKQNATVGNDQYTPGQIAVNTANWHEYTMEWSQGLCRFLLDGVVKGSTTDRVPKTKMHWVLQSETQLSGGKPLANVQGDIEIDWVAIWAKA
jgi:hypothetical protein